MQAIRKIVCRADIKAVKVPEEFGEKVELLVLPIANKHLFNESEQLMLLQEKSGFAQSVLGDGKEDVWNDI